MLNHSKEDCPKKVNIDQKDVEKNSVAKNSQVSFIEPISRATRRVVDAIMTRKIVTKHPHQGAYRTAEDKVQTVPSMFANLVKNKKAAYALGVVTGLGAAVPGAKYVYDHDFFRYREVDTNDQPFCLDGQCGPDVAQPADYVNRLSYPASVTFKPSHSSSNLSSSNLGWVETQYSANGSFDPARQTVTVTDQDGVAAVCATLYGPNNMINCEDGPCEYVNALRGPLASKHDMSPYDEAYFSSPKGLKDAASDLIACTLKGDDSCKNEFLSHGTFTNETIGDTQFQIACVLIGKNTDAGSCGGHCGPGTVCAMEGTCIPLRYNK